MSPAEALSQWDGAYRWGGDISDHPRNVTFATAGSLEASDVLLEQLANVSGARVSRRDALSVPAVLKARNRIAGILSTLPVVVHDREFHLDERNTVVADPHPEIPASVIYAATFEDLFFEGVSYWRVLRFSAEGFPVEAMHLDFRSVSQSVILGRPSEIISEDLQFTVDDPVIVDGEFVNPREIIRFISPNPPLLVHAARAIRAALLLDQVARIYADDPVPLSYFTDREDADPLDDEEIKKLLNDWQAARKKRATGYVPNSLELKTVQWNAEQIQLADARQHAVLEIARAAGLEPLDLGVDSSTSHTYNTPEQRRMDTLQFVHMPYLTAVQQRLSKNDVLPRGLLARFDTTGFLSADFKSRMEGFKIASEIGAVTRPEIRKSERRPPLSRGEESAVDGRNRPPPSANIPSNGNGQEPVEVE